jgi:hypothetical protein
MARALDRMMSGFAQILTAALGQDEDWRWRGAVAPPTASPRRDLDNRNRQLGVLRLTDATIAQSFSKN